MGLTPLETSLRPSLDIISIRGNKMEKETLLVVDDIVENIDILVELLSDYDIVTAIDGKSALKLIEQEDIDLILLDIMMPEMDGYEVCKVIKSKNKYKNTPIIFLSAKDNIADIELGFELGAVDYITKPFKPNELRARVSTHLQLRAYEKNLEEKVQEELKKNRVQEQMINQQSKQAALGELLMHIAHQWKQPLASLGSINTLQRAKLEQNISLTKEGLLHEIIKSEALISFMSQTVNTFKDFYNPSYENKYFSLTNSVNKVLNISNATLNYHNIKIDILSHEDKTTFANENEFTQVVFSIINNALDIFQHRETQNPRISIEIYNNKIIILDNAGGIDTEIQKKLFLPFESTTGGNGIGLYIAKGLLEKNGGIIYAKNVKNGAEFTIEFLEWLD